MWDRLLLSMDQFDSGQNALAMALGMAPRSGASVVVLHVRERSTMMQVPPLETLAEARSLVDRSVAALERAGVDSCGIVASVDPHHVARQIVDEAKAWGCDAIIVGSTRLRGIRRIAGSGVRDRILRTSSLPVFVAPPPIGASNRIPKLTHDRAAVR